MDPGNWATDLEGGARFGHQLLWVLVASGLIATLLQTLCARLGVVSGRDLASACRLHYPAGLKVPLWLLAEVAIIACDLAEVLGSAVALNLLFGLPILTGALLTVFDVFMILALQRRGTRTVEAVVAVLVFSIAFCLGAQLLLVRPDVAALSSGLVPRLSGESLYIAIGIVGATVMPHNLYLHSAILPRASSFQTTLEQARAVRRCFSSTAFALTLALLLNAAILVLAAAVFSTRNVAVTDLREAYHLLTPFIGTSVASALFAVGLLCSGQSSTITGTLAGQIVMEGFVRLRMSPVARRALTRGLAVLPAIVVLSILGEQGTMPLLVASQVVLSLQLPFAIVPLIRFTSSRELMGRFTNRIALKLAAGACALLVSVANAALVVRVVSDWYERAPLLASLLGLIAVSAWGLLLWISVVPLRHLRRTPPVEPCSVEASSVGPLSSARS
jgi:manganese transport protein